MEGGAGLAQAGAGAVVETDCLVGMDSSPRSVAGVGPTAVDKAERILSIPYGNTLASAAEGVVGLVESGQAREGAEVESSSSKPKVCRVVDRFPLMAPRAETRSREEREVVAPAAVFT